LKDLPVRPRQLHNGLAGLAAETPVDGGKDPECASLPEGFGWAERAIFEVMYSLLVRRSSPFLLSFHGLADDRAMILRPADRDIAKWG
jgi:hypothetical protein